MSATLAEYVDEVLSPEAEPEPQAFAFSREFCTVCYTDNVSVRADGVIFCPECGSTTRS